MTPRAFERDGRRVIFYLFYDPRGRVDDYVIYKLESLRPFAQCIVVVVNGLLQDSGRDRLESVADEVWQRDNLGFDVAGYKSGLERFGRERLAAFDELILMNYTWFGPVRPFAPVFDRMNALEVDYWGLTDHGAITPHPLTSVGTMESHIQSHWIAVRRSMFESEEWARYWEEMPTIRSYNDSILNHESRFTSHFEKSGYTYAVAFPHQNYPTTSHPAFESAEQLIEDGCPALKRRPFFHDPLYLDRHAIIGRWLAKAASAGGYPVEMIWQNMASNSPPKVLNTNASMLEIMPDVDLGYDPARPLKIAATVHIFYEDMTDELLDRLRFLPCRFDLFITTTDEGKALAIRRTLAGRDDPLIDLLEVRVLPSNRGRDLSAFFIGMRDILVDSAYDLVVKIHSKKTVQQGAAAGEFFKRQQLDNVLNSPGYAANLLALFQKEDGLGIVFPPTVHIGYPTLGGAWFHNREPSVALFEQTGIGVPVDDVSPLGAMGAMFVARPAALALLTEKDWQFDQYASESDHADGSLAHVQERIVSYAAGELGFHTRTVANTEYAAISHTFLEYKLDQLSAPVHGYAIDEVRVLRGKVEEVDRLSVEVSDYAAQAHHLATRGEIEYLKDYVLTYHPGSVAVLKTVYRPVRAVARRVRRLTSRRARL